MSTYTLVWREPCQIFEMRIELEALAAHLAAQRATPTQIIALEQIAAQGMAQKLAGDNCILIGLDRQMHQLLAQAAQNEFLEETLEWLYSHLLRLWNVSLHKVGGLGEAMDEHRRIFEAIKTGNAQHAADLMRAHVQHFQQEFLKT